MSAALKRAVDWKVIGAMPCRIRLLRWELNEVSFYDFGEFRRLVEAAAAIDPRIGLMVLLAGDSGLRRGEVIALEWTDLDLRRRTLHVQRSEWNGHVTLPKGGRARRLPMTERLAEALRQHRHLKGARVLYCDDGSTPTNKIIRMWMERAQRRGDAAGDRRDPHPPPHLLLAPRDAGGDGEGHPGARRPPEPHDDAAVHAPVAGAQGGYHPAPRPAAGRGSRRDVWRRFGDDPIRRSEAE
jgi:integrase